MTQQLFISLATVVLFTACSTRRGEVVGKPVAVDTETERRGRNVFMKNCHHCHPHGAAGLAPALNNKPLPRGIVAAQIRNGVGAMPGFSEDKIPADELDDLVEYVVTLRTRE